MTQNNFTKLPHDITNKHRNIRTNINELHKQHPIRPIVNWKDSPSYKLAKFLSEKLKDIIQLPNIYNIQNSINLIHNLKEIEMRTQNYALSTLLICTRIRHELK
jgi:hypothetical protein